MSTTDYLLKSSEIDDLSVKNRDVGKTATANARAGAKTAADFWLYPVCVCGISDIFAAYFIGHFYFEIWNPSVIFSEFLIATAIVIVICVKKLGKKNNGQNKSQNIEISKMT